MSRAGGVPRTAPVGGRGAAVLPVPPPVLYGAGFVAGLLLHRVRPWPVGGRSVRCVAGAVAVTAGVALAGAGVATVVRHRTTVLPHGAVRTLVTSGPYRWSRNPMYTGFALASFGGALLAGTWWPTAVLPAVHLVVREGVVLSEERYLTDRFGTAYTDYARRVRRWL